MKYNNILYYFFCRRLILYLNMKKKKLDAFEQREQVARFGYWEDPRWKEVSRLRQVGEIPKSNGLVLQIRSDYNVD